MRPTIRTGTTERVCTSLRPSSTVTRETGKQGTGSLWSAPPSSGSRTPPNPQYGLLRQASDGYNPGVQPAPWEARENARNRIPDFRKGHPTTQYLCCKSRTYNLLYQPQPLYGIKKRFFTKFGSSSARPKSLLAPYRKVIGNGIKSSTRKSPPPQKKGSGFKASIPKTLPRFQTGGLETNLRGVNPHRPGTRGSALA